jgi:Zn-dependent M28 family amino/carboxypeptidase
VKHSLLPAVLTVVHATWAAPAVAQGLDPEAASGTITAEDFRRRVGVIAHDSMRGRDTPSPELEEVATWIGAELRAAGLEPAGDAGTYLQHYPIRTLTVALDASTVTSSTGARAAYGEAVLPTRFSPARRVRVDAPVVLHVGGAPPFDLPRSRFQGKHAVHVGPESDEVPFLRAALSAGAASVLLATPADDPRWSRLRARAASRATRQVGDEDGAPGEPVLRVRDGVLGDLLGLDVAALRERAGDRARARELPSISLEIAQEREVVSEETAPNVVAVLPGSDPALRDEYVVFSAHMDHVGVGRPDASGDSIYNGADDDASGTVAVMEVAEAMAALGLPPRRSVLFVLVSGEEKGLWGSRYFVGNPAVPVGAMVADFNADMVGRNWSDTIVAIGREHSDLGATLARVNADHPEIGMTAIDDLWPEESFYTRSDHFNFARRGVPILFFFNGTHEDYHRPSDEPDALDAEKASRVARLLFWLGLEVANADERPAWDPGSYQRIVDGAGG